MTHDKFLIMRMLKLFGVVKSSKFLSHATSEMQTLRDGLEILGFYNRENIEPIDELKAEYWEILVTQNKIVELQEDETHLKEQLQSALSEQGQYLSQKDSQTNQLHDELTALISRREELAVHQNDIINEGRKVRKIYDGLLAKKKYYMQDGVAIEGEADIDEKLATCVSQLQVLKQKRDKAVLDYQETVDQINHHEQLLDTARSGTMHDSMHTQQNVGETNKNISNNRVEQTRLKNKLSDTYYNIGKFLYDHRRNKAVRKCIKSQARILKQVTALSNSIKLHRRLGQL